MAKTRHLTIMFTDIKGFTSKTSFSSRDKLDSFLALHDNLLAPIFRSHHGKVVKTIGDAFLVAFTSPTDAVLCGIAIQKRLKEYNMEIPKDDRLEVRVAINSGEVTIKDRDVFGETVNIAARLEGITKAGEIYFTEAVYLSMNKNEIAAREVGYKRFKGIPEKIRIFRIINPTRKRFIFFGKEKPIKRKLKKKSKIRKFLKIFVPLFIFFIIVSMISNSNKKAQEENIMQNIEQLKVDMQNAFAQMDENAIQNYINNLYDYEPQVENSTYITELIAQYESEFETLKQKKARLYAQVDVVTQRLENEFNGGDLEKIQEDIDLLDSISQELNRPDDVESTLHYYQEKYGNYVQELSDLWNDVSNTKKDIEINLAYRDASGMLQNIGVLKHLSGQLGNPSGLENEIDNYENKYDELVNELEREKIANLVATVN